MISQFLIRMRKRCWTDSSGFSLVEMIVAIIVVAIALPSIMIAFSGMKSSVGPEYNIQAAELGQFQLEAISQHTFATIPAAGAYTCAVFQATVTEVNCAVTGFTAYTYSWTVVEVDSNDPDTGGITSFAKKVRLDVSRAGMNTVSFYTLFAS